MIQTVLENMGLWGSLAAVIKALPRSGCLIMLAPDTESKSSAPHLGVSAARECQELRQPLTLAVGSPQRGSQEKGQLENEITSGKFLVM